MSDADILISYNSSLKALERELQKVKHSGNYFTSGIHETPMPLVRIDGASTLSFPVPEEQACRLIGSIAELAPYGRGDQTLVDQEVRKVWQIDASRLSITGKGWERAFGELLGTVARQLGCAEKGMEAELYKLLIYDEGAHFAAHRDTEKAPGMFGTLVISLPAFHQGGDLAIRHHGRETILSLTCDDPGEVRYAAFYADCEHEVYPITEGYRVCLIYNLVSKGKAKLPVPDDQTVVKAVTSRLRSWVTSKSEPEKLVYLLEHRYTQATISFAGLKGLDTAKARVLQEAAAKAKCALHLGILHIVESGWAEYTGGYGYRGRRGRYADEDDEYEIGEVCDGSYYIDQWRDGNDVSVDFGQIPLRDEEVLPHGCLDDAKPDEAHFSEATGNEGASFERTYLRAALVIWPEERFDEICISGGQDAAICRLGQVVRESRASEPAVAKAAGKRLARLMTLLPQWWPSYGDHSAALGRLLGHFAVSENPKLIAEGVRQVPLFEHYHPRLHLPFLSCTAILPRKEREALLTDFFRVVTVKKPAAALELWSHMASRFPEEKELLRKTMELLLEECPKIRIQKASRPHSVWMRDLEILEKEVEEAPKSEMAPELLADFVRTVAPRMGHDWALRFISSMEQNTGFFSPDTLLLPTLELLVKEKLPSLPSLALWELCAVFYLHRSAMAPEEPKDWALPLVTRLSGREPLLRELEKFARDPEAREHRFRVRKEIRQTLHRAIDEAGLDMDHVTLRVGSPQTLVCTKNRASYKRAYLQYERDLAGMRRLLALSHAKESAEKTRKLKAALANKTPRYRDKE